MFLDEGGVLASVGVDVVDDGKILRDDFGKGKDLGVARADGGEGIDVVADFTAFVAVELGKLAAFLVTQVVEEIVLGIDRFGIGDGFEEFVVSSLRVGVAIVSLMGSRGGEAGDDATAESDGARSGGEGEFDVTERRREEFGEFEVDGAAFDSADDIAPGAVSSHAAGEGIMTAAAHLHRDAMEDGHVFLVGVEALEPIGELVFVEIGFEGFLLLVLAFFFFRKGGEGEGSGNVAVGFSDKDEAMGRSDFGGFAEEMIEGWRQGQSGGAEAGVFEKVSSIDHRVERRGLYDRGKNPR